MKKFYKSWTFKLISYIVLFIVTLSVFLFCILTPGTDYTRQYETYKQVKDIELLSELKSYCVENDIHYSISDSKIKIIPNSKYELTFKINGDKLFVEDLDRNFYFETLEEQISPEIVVKTYEKNDKILESLKIDDALKSYTLKNNHFYEKNAFLLGMIPVLCLYFMGLWLYKIDCTISSEKAKKKMKKEEIRISKRNPDLVENEFKTDDYKIQD